MQSPSLLHFDGDVYFLQLIRLTDKYKIEITPLSMSRQQNFNIITGEVKREYPMGSTSRRFSSQAEIKRAKQNGEYNQHLPKQVRRLGTSSDSRAFNYAYPAKNQPGFNTIDSMPRVNSYAEKTSLINASKLAFNFINHTESSEPISKWENTRKQAPLSKETHMGRFNAPNYSKDFADRLNSDATGFHRKRAACTEMCHIQKSYGVDKLFRKYK